MNFAASHRRAITIASPLLLSLITFAASPAVGHPLGNFTINHYTAIRVSRDSLRVRYVVDIAEIPTIQELQQAGSKDTYKPSDMELQVYLSRVSSDLAKGLLISSDGSPVALTLSGKSISLPDGAGGLKTLRIVCDLDGSLDSGAMGDVRKITVRDENHPGRIGWREMLVSPETGISIFNSSIYGNGLTDELKAYPQDRLAAPLDEREGQFSFIFGPAPTGVSGLLSRQGKPVIASRDKFAELISVPTLTPGIALIGLLIAFFLGTVHAMSPGHGKTIVGAYLVGSRGSARHAAFLGSTVTITHTSVVFALGAATLLASKYVVPEKLFPILSLISGALVLGIGLTLLIKRSRIAASGLKHPVDNFASEHDHEHSFLSHAHDEHDDSHPANHVHSHHGHPHHHHSHDDAHVHSHTHETDEIHVHSHHQSEHEGDSQSHSDDRVHGELVHSHGGHVHSHLPPGADGKKITWNSLLALGVSGGLLPCPSALVVLLSAVALHRVGYGLALVLAFSIGLASTLTMVGLVFVYAGRLLKRLRFERKAGSKFGPAFIGRAASILPAMSAMVITCAGAVICYDALIQSGIRISSLLFFR